MSDQKTQARLVNPFRSLFFKCTFMVAICVLAVVATIEFRNQGQIIAKAQNVIAMRALEMTKLLSMQMGGGIRFGNTAALAEIAETAMATAGADVLGAAIYDQSLTPMVLTQGIEMQSAFANAAALAEAAISSGTIQRSADGTVAAAPVVFGDGDEVVGVVVTAWTTAFTLQDIRDDQFSNMLIGIGVFLAALVTSALYLRSQMSHPLVTLEGAMQKVAEADFSPDVPYTARHDEVGQMARSLDAFRRQLSAAKAAQAEAIFKGAAFEGSSAAMMLVDADHKVLFANSACKHLLCAMQPALGQFWPDVEPEDLVGADFSEIPQLRQTLAAVANPDHHTAGNISCETVTIRIGDKIVRVTANPAFNAEGQFFGSVIEWTDRTRSQHNSALIEAINAGQISIEFDREGAVHDANQNFLDLIGGMRADLTKDSFFKMFAGNIDGDKDGKKFVASVRSKETTQGRFSAYSAHANKAFIVEGNFTVVPTEDGSVDRVIFIGRDVTEQDKAMREAEFARERLAQEQKQVVELLGVALNRLADGDLEATIDAEVPHTYEKLRTDFNATVASLRDAIGLVIHNAGSIRSETAEITSAADDLSRRTEKQAATLEETAAALDELTVSVRSAAQGADDASKMSADAQRNAQQGGEVARRAVAAMDGIKTSSQEISKITSVIDDIAFQTNLLALNAGVEAARAGEAGRGFAVVATEVRALAQRSSDAAREINALINSSGEQVTDGVELVDRTGAALAAIVISVSEISERVSSIAASAREQASGLAEINTAVNELDHVTQQNAAMFEETTAASHALTSEADALASAVQRFRLGAAMPPVQPKVSSPPAAAQPTAKPKPLVMTQGNSALAISAEIDADGWEEF